MQAKIKIKVIHSKCTGITPYSIHKCMINNIHETTYKHKK